MKLRAIIFTAIMTLVTASCSRTDLNGDWKIVSVGSDDIESTQAAPTISFDQSTGLVHGYTGVNIFNGEYTQEGRRLTISNIGMTRMAGPAEDMELENKIISSFEEVHSAKMTDKDELVFIGNQDDTLMVLVRKNQ